MKMSIIIFIFILRAGFLTLDGKTKCFDKEADGYVRSDTIGVLFLQKAKDARRIYAEVCHVKMNYELLPHCEFTPMRETKSILDFLEKFYSEINVSPDEVEYVEAHASAIPNADSKEVEAISIFFSKKKPIKIGSVKSNMGHSESASGISSLTKVCLAYHKGKIAANLHFKNFDETVSSICKDKVQVLQEHADFQRKYIAMNCFSFTGVNIHVLLKGHYKKKDSEKYKSGIPQLLNVSCRNESNVQQLFKKLVKNGMDAEQIALCRCIYEKDTPGHTFRGHIILDMNEQKETEVLSQAIEYFDGSRRPVCFVYSGMGSQWPGMGAELLRISIFATAIERCHAVLKPLGINIYDILCDKDNDVFKNILNSFIGITVMQIGLTDILYSIGITADYIVGHSLGEIACAYADGCLSLEETVLAAYSRGMVSIETDFIYGSMAAVGLGYKEIKSICPPEIDIACRNSSTSSTISGPAEVMKTFVNQLTTQKYFAKEVASNNIPYHSRYIAHAESALKSKLKDVIKQPKLRSKNWISSSVPKAKWATDAAKYSSAEYHTNNLLNPVYFEEAAGFIPNEAIFIEIAPHGLLNAILKRSNPNGVHVSLTKRKDTNPNKFILEAIGKLYMVGLSPKIAALYPKIEYPVSTETPMLSHLVEWEHSEIWPVDEHKMKKEVFSTAREYNISSFDDEYTYLSEYSRNGLHVFPESLFLILTWQTFAMANRKELNKTSIVFENIKFYDEIVVRMNESLKVHVSITKGSNSFQVTNNDSRIAEGIIGFMENCTDYEINEKHCHNYTECYQLTTNDIYSLLYLKGYSYTKSFQGFQSCAISCDKANILWKQNWTVFLDALIQFNILGRKHTGISVPKFIRKITIDTTKHDRTPKLDDDGNKFYNADILGVQDVTECGGVTIDKIIFEDLPLIQQEPDIIYSRQFRPFVSSDPLELKAALIMQLQIASENLYNDTIILTEIISMKDKFNGIITEAMEQLQFVDFKLKSLQIKNNEYDENDVGQIKNSNILFGNDLLKDEKICTIINNKTFIISFQTDADYACQLSYCIISSVPIINNSELILFKKLDTCASINSVMNVVTYDQNCSHKYLHDGGNRNKYQLVLESGPEKYYEVNQFEPKRLNMKTHIFIEDENSTAINIDNQLCKEQLKKKLKYNVLRKGQWGGYYYFPMKTKACSKIRRLTIRETGNLDTLCWIQQSTPKSHITKHIKVEYAGLSLQDYYKAIKWNSDNIEKLFGMDFSGIDLNGNRVMGLLPEGSISNYVEADSTLLWPVPEHWHLDEAATVILPYVQAYYCLFLSKFGIDYGSIFINGGAGAFGIAVIAISLSLKWKVFTMVGNIKKKCFLHKLFPQLDEENISCSDPDAFYQVVAKKTNNNGCNIVINCGDGTNRKDYMKYVGMCGVFLDTSRYEILPNFNLGMFYLTRNRYYKPVNVSNIFKPESLNERQILQRLVADGIATGIVKPIPKIVYSPDEVVKGLRLLSRRQYKGRILIKTSGIVNGPYMQITSRTTCNYNATQIIVCDNEILSIGLIERLLNRGSRKFLVCGKIDHKSGIFAFKLRSWEKFGVIIKTFDMVIKTAEYCTNAIGEAENLGPVEGIFIVLSSDQNILKMNVEMCIDETITKICNFDILSRKMCKNLSNFVIMYEDVYNFGCEDIFLIFEKICQDRKDQGLPALAFRPKIGSQHSTNNNSMSSLSISAVLNGLEVGIETGCTKILAIYKKEGIGNSKLQFLSKISQILGGNINEINDDVILGDLIQNISILEEVRTLIKIYFQLYCTVKDLERLPIKSLYEIQNFSKEKTQFNDGIKVFISNIEKEMNAILSDHIRIMPTLLPRDMEEIVNFDHDGKYLILLPELDGNHRIFLPLFERLKIRAVAIDYETISVNDSFKNIAAKVLENIKKRLNINSKFFIMGYSFGVNIAIELVALLENQGYRGVLYALDSSPDALKVQFDAYVGKLSISDLQNTILNRVFSMVSRDNGRILDENFERSDKWEKKINYLISNSKHSLQCTHQYVRKILENLYKRITLFQDYQPDVNLNSQIILIKGIAHPNSKNLENDYSLSKYSKQPIKIFHIESDHAMAPYDIQVSKIVNQHLDAKYIKEYNESNLCESYLF